MTARLWPARRHLVLVTPAGPVHLGHTTDPRHALDRRIDLAPEYGVTPDRIQVRRRAPRKGVSCV